MLEMKLTITAPELSEAIGKLAEAIKSLAPASPDGTAPAAPQENAYVTAEAAPQEAKPAPAAAAPPAVPTAPPRYTCDMLAKAGAVLVDAGKMNELLNLLAKFGVEAITSLDPAQYGAFATELRAMGGQI